MCIRDRNAGIKISLTDLRVKDEEGNAKKEIFYSEEGLKEFVRYVDSSREHFMNDVIYINTEKQGTPVEVAIMYNTSYNENVHSYVNNINTIEGGTHLAGFRRALTRTLKKYAEDNKMLEKAKVEIAGDDFREGLTAVILSLIHISTYGTSCNFPATRTNFSPVLYSPVEEPI